MTVDVGLYGKLPSHGDFLRRRTTDAFVDVWDRWLQECLAASRAALGDRWLDVYLTSPAWRFACAPGVCGPAPVLGLLVPSVDRVGRYFPLTIVAELPRDTNLIAAATRTATFFGNAERLVADALEADTIDFEEFDAHIERLGEDLAGLVRPGPVVLDVVAGELFDGSGDAGWQLPIGSTAELAPVFEQLLAARLAFVYEPLVVWWTEGSSRVEPSCVLGSGLPAPHAFAALLDGSWAEHAWRTVPADVVRDDGFEHALLPETQVIRVRSAAATDQGCVRQMNQDAFLERPDMGIWVVADGLGGHSNGHIASRMVCDALADLGPVGGLEELIGAVRGRLFDVNDHLLRTAAQSLLADRSGSTVVVLLVRRTECAIVWAGDSRAYRWRDGRLQQLTRDHSVEAEALVTAGRARSHIVTRAVGVAAHLELDVLRDRVEPGDRFLLCSDGLSGVLSDADLHAWVEHAPDAAVQGLIQATLAAGAPDNVTVLIAEASADAGDRRAQ